MILMDCFKGKSIGTKLGPWFRQILADFFGPFLGDEAKPVPGPHRPGKCPVQSSPSALPFATLVPGSEHLQHPEALGNVGERRGTFLLFSNCHLASTKRNWQNPSFAFLCINFKTQIKSSKLLCVVFVCAPG